MAKTPNIDLREDYSRNYIINGNFDFWQRGVSQAGVLSGIQADRFRYASDNMPVDIERSTDTPSENNAFYSHRVFRNTAQGAPSASQVSYIRYSVEGLDYLSLHSKTVTLSFWAKSDLLGTYSINLSNNAQDRRYIAKYTIDSVNTWEKKVITLDLDDQGTWLFDNQTGLQINFILAAGSSYRTINTNSWLASAPSQDWASNDQVNWSESAGNSFRLSQVQVVEGTQDLPFRRAGKTISDELQLCQRYYWKDTVERLMAASSNTSNVTTTAIYDMFYPVEMRVNPTVTFNTTTELSGLSFRTSNNRGFSIIASAISGNTPRIIGINAEAEL